MEILSNVFVLLHFIGFAAPHVHNQPLARERLVGSDRRADDSPFERLAAQRAKVAEEIG